MKDTFLLILFLSLLTCSYVACYNIGLWNERRAYTASFVKQVEAAYWDGFGDGEKQGNAKGLKQGYKNCLNEDYAIRDKY